MGVTGMIAPTASLHGRDEVADGGAAEVEGALGKRTKCGKLKTEIEKLSRSSCSGDSKPEKKAFQARTAFAS
jgi:hypothetical protein